MSIESMTLSYLFTDEELKDIEAAAEERDGHVECIIRNAVLDDIAS